MGKFYEFYWNSKCNFDNYVMAGTPAHVILLVSMATGDNFRTEVTLRLKNVDCKTFQYPNLIGVTH